MNPSPQALLPRSLQADCERLPTTRTIETVTDPTPWDAPDPEPSWTDDDAPTWEQPSWAQPPFAQNPPPGPDPAPPHSGQPSDYIPPAGQPYPGPFYPAPPPTLTGPVITGPRSPRKSRGVGTMRSLAFPIAILVGFLFHSWWIAIVLFLALTVLPGWIRSNRRGMR